jgi:hypothetical protein
MVDENSDGLTLEKLKIDERLQVIESYVKQGKELRGSINETLTVMNAKMFGDPRSKDKKDRDGFLRRLEALEDDKEDHLKLRENFLKVAIGAITLAVGSFVLWAWKVVIAGIHAIKGG